MLIAIAASALACSASTTAPGAPNSDVDGGTEPDGDSVAGGPFDLKLTVNLARSSGAPWASSLAVAVRDAETGELIAFAGGDDAEVTTRTVTAAGALQPGRRYVVGIRQGWLGQCHDLDYAGVWYREYADLTGNVDEVIEVREGVERDTRGCDVILEKAAIPTGSYATKAPVLGVSGNRVEVVVSETGRVYVKSVRIFCSNPSCSPTTVSRTPCSEIPLIPGAATTFSLGDSGSKTSVKGTATIDPVTKKIRYVGRTSTWTASGTTCCDEAFDTELVLAGAPSMTCR